MSDSIAILLIAISGMTFLGVVFLFAALSMSSLDDESWENNDIGKGCDDVEED